MPIRSVKTGLDIRLKLNVGYFILLLLTLGTIFSLFYYLWLREFLVCFYIIDVLTTYVTQYIMFDNIYIDVFVQ